MPQKFIGFLQEFDDDDARILGTQMLASLEIPDGKYYNYKERLLLVTYASV